MMENTYTYWSTGELRILQRLRSQGYGYEEMARILHRSAGAVKARLYYLDNASLAMCTDPDETLITMRKKWAVKEVE